MSWEKGQYEGHRWGLIFFLIGVLFLDDVLISTVQRSEPAICTHVSPPARTSLPPTPALWVTTEHWAEPPVLHGGPPLAICFTRGGRTDSVLCATQQRSRPPSTAASQHLDEGVRKLDWAQQVPGTFHFLPLCSHCSSLPICFSSRIFQFYSYTWVSFYFFCHCWNVLPHLSVSGIFAITFEVFLWWVL